MSGERKGKRAKTPLAERAYRILKGRIVEGSLAEGEPLCEEPLAEDLGMSRTPVRTAIRRLEEEGYLMVVPRRGAFVTSLSVQEYRDVNDLRSVLEPLALETSICRIPAEHLVRHREMWTAIARDIEEGRTVDRSELIARDEEFHAFIVDYCLNRRLQGVMSIIRRQVVQIRLLSWMEPVFYPKSVREHVQLIDLIERRELSATQELLKEHILLKRKYIEPFIGR